MTGFGGSGLGGALGAVGLLLVASESGASGASPPHRVVIERFAFVPSVVTIRPGEAVAWVSADLAPHTVTAVDGAWDTGPLARNGVARVALTRPGRYPYGCAYHPHMKGVVVVVPD